MTEAGEKDVEELKRDYKSRTRITGDDVIPGMENLGTGQDTTDNSWRSFSELELEKLVRHGIISPEWCVRYKAQLCAAQKPEQTHVEVEHNEPEEADEEEEEEKEEEKEEARGEKEKLKRDYKSRTRITGDDVPVPGMENLGKGQDTNDMSSWPALSEVDLDKLARHGIISQEWVVRYKAHLAKTKPAETAGN